MQALQMLTRVDKGQRSIAVGYMVPIQRDSEQVAIQGVGTQQLLA